eukprot:gene22133-biopygen23694
MYVGVKLELLKLARLRRDIRRDLTGVDIDDIIAFANQDPFVPNDLMDWMVGSAAVAAGYTGAYLIGGPAGILRYEAVVPSIAVFASAVAMSNIAQSSVTSRGGRTWCTLRRSQPAPHYSLVRR